jgi:hypothetical protein
MKESELISIFADPVFGNLLVDPPGRTELINDLGQVMHNNGWSYFEDLYEQSEHWITRENGLFALLSRFRAYRDPVRKKSCFVLALMRNSKLWTYPDNDQLGPPVDYHEVRGHLRIGTVKVTNPILDEKLHKGLPVTPDEDIAIRQSVYDAIMLLSEWSGLRNPSQLHYLFWNVFRSHCIREQPYCTSFCPNLPQRYQHLAFQNGTYECPFAGVCSSVDTSDRYYEHVFETDYY